MSSPSDRPEPTYKVIRLVADSAQSFEDAARNAVAEAAKTITYTSKATSSRRATVSITSISSAR